MSSEPMETSRTLETLSLNERAQLEELLLQKLEARSSFIPRRADDGPCVLSFGQERMWLLQQIYPDSTAYTEINAVRLDGLLDRHALQTAFDALVARHEILRTTYHALDGIPQQVIHAHTDVPIQFVDLSALPHEARQLQLQTLMRQQEMLRFDLENDVGLRVTVFCLAPHAHVLYITKHHIAHDALSTRVLHREVFELYQAYAQGQTPALPELPIQYADFAIWQRAQTKTPEYAKQLAYWREQLAELEPLDFPTDHPRPAVPTFQGATFAFEFDAALHAPLRALARRHNVTDYMLMLAAYVALLSRYTAQTDIAVGMPIAGRTRVETEPLIGFFVNTLVLRADLSGNPTFQQLLQRVRQIALEAFDHQAVPFEALVQELEPERALNRNPLIQHLFQVLNDAPAQFQAGALQVTRLPTPHSNAKVDLQFNVHLGANGMRGVLTYSTELFERGTIERLTEHYQNILRGILEHIETPVAQIDLISAQERAQLFAWSKNPAPMPDCTLHALFQAQVQKQPLATALTFNDRSMSYAHLNAAANQLARKLRRAGAGPNVIVGIAANRSLEAIVAMLAILKAGSAYLPLDPNYPQERLRFMLDDTAAPIVLTQAAVRAQLPSFAGQSILLDEIWNPNNESAENLETQNTLDDIAYVIYTSGSSGAPKGTLISHRAAANFIAGQCREPEFGAGKRVLQFASYSFDASVWEIFGALCSGATLCLAQQETLQSTRELSMFLRREAITTAILPPSFLAELPPTELSALETLFAAAEMCPAELAARWGQGRRFFNAYGPTETTVMAARFWYDAQKNYHTALPIGTPTPNTELYVLDASQNLAPIGVPGELYIGGPGVASGYLSRPELTAEKFVPHPFADAAGLRVYRSGDRARFLPDGNVEFLGRLDQQIKLRGFRIELGEIEQVLTQHPAVQQALVTLQTHRGDKQLAAYVILRERENVTAQALRHYLQTRLPHYMIPAYIVFVPSLPRTPSGKIDRRALPPLDIDAGQDANPFVAPRTDTEKQLAKIWCEVMGVARVGLHDNFFEMGGHSLMAALLVSNIVRELNVELPLALLFTAPTIAQLAAHVETPLRSDNPIVVPIQSAGALPPLFCVHGFGGAVIDYYALGARLAPTRPVYGLQAFGLENDEVLDKTIPELAARYVQAIRAAQPHGPYHLSGYCFGGLIAYEMACQLRAQGHAVGAVALLETPAPRRVRTTTPLYDPRRWILFWRTIPFWLDEYWNMSRADLWQTLRYRSRMLQQNVTERLGRGRELTAQQRVRHDLDMLPPRHRRLLEAQLHALREFVPQPYDGRIDVFAARNMTPTAILFGSIEGGRNWEKLAARVCSHTVSGNHVTLLHEPHVESLANAVQDAMAAMEQTGASRG